LEAIMLWQVQEAKQRFSELLRAAASEGPQIVTRHGNEIAVVIDVTEFRRLRGDTIDFKDYLRSDPEFDDLELARSDELPGDIDWEEAG
jgi:prevent-host-death family protein